MMKIVNTTPMVLNHQIQEAIAKAVADYRRDYPKGFTRKCTLKMETMVNLLLSMQGRSLKKELYDAGIDVIASAFVQNDSKLKCYNQLHVTPLYDVLNKTYQHCIIQLQSQMYEVGCFAFYLS